MRGLQNVLLWFIHVQRCKRRVCWLINTHTQSVKSLMSLLSMSKSEGSTKTTAQYMTRQLIRTKMSETEIKRMFGEWFIWSHESGAILVLLYFTFVNGSIIISSNVPPQHHLDHYALQEKSWNAEDMLRKERPRCMSACIKRNNSYNSGSKRAGALHKMYMEQIAMICKSFPTYIQLKTAQWQDIYLIKFTDFCKCECEFDGSNTFPTR